MRGAKPVQLKAVRLAETNIPDSYPLGLPFASQNLTKFAVAFAIYASCLLLISSLLASSVREIQALLCMTTHFTPLLAWTCQQCELLDHKKLPLTNGPANLWMTVSVFFPPPFFSLQMSFCQKASELPWPAVSREAITDKACELTSQGGFEVRRVVCVARLKGTARGDQAKHSWAEAGTVGITGKHANERERERFGSVRAVHPCAQGRDVWYSDFVGKQAETCECEWMDSEDPLFMLYTSGSTGKPKGVLHTTGAHQQITDSALKYYVNVTM